ncbi:MAG: SDR family NAD(P)-dependent oxidoreductase [Candidatus Peribacteria bacterium]|nr:MAG: SDR family NAD(P)-dependent oxidoreductase [Candidatus Peribacteria bacterium]
MSADSLLYHECDVTDFQQLQKAIADTQDRRGNINTLFCCAGTHITGDIITTSLDDRNQLRTLNVTHMFMTMKYIIPQMQAAQ